MLPDAPTDFLPPVAAACPLPRHRARRLAAAWAWANVAATLGVWTWALVKVAALLYGWG